MVDTVKAFRNAFTLPRHPQQGVNVMGGFGFLVSQYVHRLHSAQGKIKWKPWTAKKSESVETWYVRSPMTFPWKTIALQGFVDAWQIVILLRGLYLLIVGM